MAISPSKLANNISPSENKTQWGNFSRKPIWNLFTAHYQSCLSVSFSHSLTCHVNTLVCIVLLWSNKCPTMYRLLLYTNPVPPETRRMTYKLHSQQRSRFRFSILPVLYMQDTFVLVLNFEVGHFARHFLFLLVLLWKELTSHSFVVTFHFSRSFGSPPDFYPAMDVCWIHVKISCSTCIYSMLLIVSLNDEPWLAHRRQQSAGSAFQFHYTIGRNSEICLNSNWHQKTI